MGRRDRKAKPSPPTFEQEIAGLGPRPGLDQAEPWMDRAGAAAQIGWDWKRQRLLDQIRVRDADAARIVDPGPDASGNFGVSPYAARHHRVEAAPKKLGEELPKHSAFPKRIATQRMIDRYRAQGLLTARQWKAADRLWRIWRDTGRDPNLVASYSPQVIRGTCDPDHKMVGRTDAVADWEDCRRLCGVLGFGVLVDVVIWDRSASDWACEKGHSVRASQYIGMAFLQGGLDVLAAHFRY